MASQGLKPVTLRTGRQVLAGATSGGRFFRDCSATKFTEWGGLAGPVTLYGIEVAREDIEAAKVCEPLSTRQPVLKPHPLCRQRRLQLNQSL
jgi:hypothetical protein